MRIAYGTCLSHFINSFEYMCTFSGLTRYKKST